MNRRGAVAFARRQMLEEGETVIRDDKGAGPFVVALVELSAGGYDNRAAQPAAVYGNRRSTLPPVARIETYGPSRYRDAALRFNSLVDTELT